MEDLEPSAIEVLSKLRQVRNEQSKPSLDAITLSDVKSYPTLFQPREKELDEYHVSDLLKAIRNHGQLDPILVLQVGSEAVLVDGHHRLEAYKRSEYKGPIPAEFFEGTLEEAILEAGNANTKVRLQMTNEERQNRAWELVRLGRTEKNNNGTPIFSKEQIRKSAGISDGQVAKMRRVLEQLGASADDYATWGEALYATKEKQPEFTDEELQKFHQMRAKDTAKKIKDAAGQSFAKYGPEFVVMVLEELFKNDMADVMGYLPAWPEETNGEEDYFEIKKAWQKRLLESSPF